MAREQQQFVICVPILAGKRWPGFAVQEVEECLDRLGNPAIDNVKARLDENPIIHFMSMSVAWAGVEDPDAYLLIDITGDGTRGQILRFLGDRIGLQLLPVFAAARGVRTLGELRRCLRRFALDHSTNWFTNIVFWFQGSKLGLPFPGTPGMTVKRIKEEKKIAEAARSVVYGKATGGPRERWRQVRRKLQDEKIEFMIPKEKKAAYDPDRQVRSVPLAILPLLWNSWLVRYPVELTLLIAVAALWLFGARREGVDALAKVSGNWIGELSASFYSAMIYVGTQPLSVLADAVGIAAAGLVMAVMLVLMSFVILAGLLGWSLQKLRKMELTDAAHDLDPDTGVVAAIMRRENSAVRYADRDGHRDERKHKQELGEPIVQNHLTAISTVKPGSFRRLWTLRLGLHLVELAVLSNSFKKGFLSNIGTIHFAQWIRIPGNKLVFLSNYDGSWESYLEDFVTKASQGLNIVWSNTVDYPRTNWLASGGAEDGDRFKRWVRRQQIPTLFWYSAYPELTTRQIRDNANIRYGLAYCDTEADVEAWLATFGSAPRPKTSIEAHQVQRLVFSGLARHREARCLLLRFPDCGKGANKWIDELLGSDRIQFGDALKRSDERPAMFVAFTRPGLEKLGVARRGRDETDMTLAKLAANFPASFELGMNDETRRVPLGDSGSSAPDQWDWGQPGNDVDATLLIYAFGGPSAIESLVQEETARVERLGLRVLRTVEFEPLPESGPMVEPFGYVDGISQPILSGTDRAARQADSADVLEPGEIILGYPDGRSNYPPTPQVFVSSDGKGFLPSLPPEFPANGNCDSEDVRDLGRNGSYLVIRQLEQNVEAFKTFVAKAPEAEGIKVPSQVSDKGAWIAAKMLGRWPNGASLVRNPYQEPRKGTGALSNVGDNDFLYGRDDPQGLRCPVGAHIRRANPRDSFAPDDSRQLSITNRHRILRRGRVYVDKEKNKKGLFFMCLNADIERQFEFIQQTWLSSNAFEGLRDEADVFAQTPPADAGFTIPTTEGPIRLENLQSFVTVKGGAYFFLPSRRALQFLSGLRG